MWADHKTSGWQYCEHFGHTNRDHRLGDLEGRARFDLSRSQPGPGEQHADPNAEDKRHNGEPDRVHETIVG